VTVYLQDADLTVHHGDALETLRTLPDESVHMCVTSPPFFGLRDYGTGAWDGGDPDCDHIPPKRPKGTYVNGQGQAYTSNNTNWDKPHDSYRDVCGKCGARRVDNQIGLEASPQQWADALVAVFREVRRVLRADGTLWIECGDAFADKQLGGHPWRLAFALQEGGWFLRSDIIWARPNPMPESVTDRPTKSHSYVFLLAKQPRYYFDADAIREDSIRAGDIPGGSRQGVTAFGVNGGWAHGSVPSARNKRSVWTIPTQPLPDQHYAAYPEALVEPCILAGTSERGVCPVCGAPWVRETEKDAPPENYTPGYTPAFQTRRFASATGGYTSTVTTTGWRPTCAHDLEPAPATVLDPFLGSGTTALVARRLGRRCVGIELSADYCQMIARRTQQLSVLAEATA
jgi:DNA modification methylase